MGALPSLGSRFESVLYSNIPGGQTPLMVMGSRRTDPGGPLDPPGAGQRLDWHDLGTLLGTGLPLALVMDFAMRRC